MSNYHQAFFELLRAGLWEKEAQLASYEGIDYAAIMRMAEEQSVVGLLTAGVSHVIGVKVPQEWTLQFIGSTLQVEQRNRAMNTFVEDFFRNISEKGIYAVLVKGQGVALCYEKPQWRTSGDVDLFLSDENYQKAKNLLRPMASIVEPETEFKKHLGLMIDGWLVELHGSLRNGLSSKMDKALDCIKHETFYSGHVRSGIIGNTQVFMLSIENDIMYVFSHILDHFYKGGIGLRQICDWVRLIWTYRDSLNLGLLKLKIRRMGVMTEWKVFGALAVDWLGMPSEAMPFYSSDAQWSRKAVRIKDFVMEVGNFGHNRDMSYYDTKPFIVKKAFSFWVRVKDLYHHAQMFPLDSIRFFWGITVTGMKAIAKGK